MYGLPGERASRLGVHRLGYRPLPGGMAYLVADTAVTGRLRRRPFAGRLTPEIGKDLAQVGLLADACPATRLQARRDADFIRWRFLRHPVRRYRLLRYGAWGPRPNKDWRGYAVLSAESGEAVLEVTQQRRTPC